MIALVIAFQLTTTVTYTEVPAEVERIAILEWHDDRAPASIGAADVHRDGPSVTARAIGGTRTLVLFERADGAYALDGPFTWPTREAWRVLDKRWRRTSRGITPADRIGASQVEWLSARAGDGAEWPRCIWTGAHEWACWGIPVTQSGVLISRAMDRLWWTVVSGATASPMRSAAWGRLLRVSDEGAEASRVRVTAARPVASAQRVRGVRLETASVAGAQAVSVAAGAVWLTGEDASPDAWIEAISARGGPTYMGLADVAEGDPRVVLDIALRETRTVDGVVVGGHDEQAGGALVSLFRLIDPPPAPNESKPRPPRRVVSTETITDGNGVFHLDRIGEADYQLVVWHPQSGRVSLALPRSDGVLTVRLQPSPLVRGRVVSAGIPLAGIPIVSLPDPQAAREAIDLIDVKGGDARSGPDGRFVVALSAAGGGELRVGGGNYPVRRVPLPRAASSTIDVGDVDLGAPITLTIVLDRDAGCDLRATGPVGQSGLQIVAGQRTGPGLFRMTLPEPGLWEFGLACGREEHGLSPAVVSIDAARAGKEVRLSVR